MFGVSHGAIQFMVYEELKNWYNNYLNVPIDTKLVGLMCNNYLSIFIYTYIALIFYLMENLKKIFLFTEHMGIYFLCSSFKINCCRFDLSVSSC